MNARLVFDLQVRYQDPAVVLPRFASIPLTDDIQGLGALVSVCEDVSVDMGGGLLRRTLRLAYSPLFLTTYPTYDEKRSVLVGLGLNILNARLPARVVFNGGLSDYEANDCPP